MKKLMTLLGVMAFALGAFADNISGVNFDNVTSLGKLSSNTGDNPTMTPGTTGSTTYWYSAAGEDLDASVTAYADDQPVQTTVASGESNVNYLKIESAPYTAPLYRSITANEQDGAFEARSIGDGLYIDTLVQFTVGSDSADQLDSAAKLALWVGTSEDTENAPTNIFVRAGYISESGLVATNYAFNVPANFSPENWYRVTVKAINNIVSSGTEYVGFVVFVDDVALEPGANAISDDPLTLAPAISSKFSGKIFPSMIPSGATSGQALSAVGFSGTGAVDDLAFTATAPFADAMDQVAFLLEWDRHVATLGVTIGGVSQAVDVEDLSKVFLYNVSDTVSISITYENGYTSTYGNAVEFTENVPDVITITSYAPGAAYWHDGAWVNVADIDAALVEVGKNGGGTIKLLAAETQLSDVFNVNAGEGVVVLDLAGKTLLGAAGMQVVGVESGTLVITNSTVEVGKILANDRDYTGSEGDEGSIFIGDGATLKVYGGLIDGIIYGETVDEETFQIFGGTFYAYDMDSDDDAFIYADYVAEGKYATPAQDEGVWYVTVGDEAPTPPPAETFVISIVKTDFTTNKYETVGEAFEAIAEGDKLVVLDDLELALPSDCSNDIEIPDGVAITFDEGDYTFSGTFDGAGTVAMTAKPKAVGAARFAETWTGTFQVCWDEGDNRFVLDDFGNANSTVEIVGNNQAFSAFPFSAWSGGDAAEVQTKVAIAEGTTWTVANGNAHRNDSDWNITTFPVLTGGGNLVVNGTGSGTEPIEYEIGVITNFTGTLSGNRGKYKIGNIAVAGTPGFDDCLVKVGNNFKYRDLDQTTVNEAAATLAVGTVSEQKGVYLARATVAGVGYVSIADAIAAAESTGETLVTVLDGTSAAQTGWIYDNGTYVPTVATVGDTPYASLEAAITAADEGETKTVVVYRRTNESVSIPNGVTVQSNTTAADFCGTLTGGSGTLVYSQTPSVAPTIGEDFEGVVCLYFNYNKYDVYKYGNAKSTIALGAMTGYIHDGSAASGLTGDIPSTVRIDDAVVINNGWPLTDGAASWTHNKVVKIAKLKVDGSLTLSYSGTAWTGGDDTETGYYKATVLDASGAGTIVVGNKFALRIDAVDFAAEPSGNNALVTLTLSGTREGKLYGPNGIAGENIPVTVNGVATGQSLVYDAAKGGLVLYVAPEPSPAIDPSMPTELDVGPEATKEQAEAAAAAMDVAKTEDASGVDQDVWNGYFTKTVEMVDDKWVATAALNPAVVLPVDGAEDTPLTDMLESVTAAALDDKTPTAVPTKAGLYYWIAGATEVGATTYTPGTAKPGNGETQTLAMPVLSNKDGKAFYKVCVGLEAPVTPVAEP